MSRPPREAKEPLRPQVPVDEWCKNYGINLAEKRQHNPDNKCQVCGGPEDPRPIAFDDMRGVEFICDAHPNHGGMVLVPVAGSESDAFWNGLFGMPPRRKRCLAKRRSKHP